MKIKYYVILAALFLIGCDNSQAEEFPGEQNQPEEPTAMDINVDDLTTACQCVDAIEMVLVEVAHTTQDSITNEAIELGGKYKEIEQRCIVELQISKSEAQACPNFNDIFEKMNQYQEILMLGKPVE